MRGRLAYSLTGMCTSRLAGRLRPTTRKTFSSDSPSRSSVSRRFWIVSTCARSALIAFSHWALSTGSDSNAGATGVAFGLSDAGKRRGGGACFMVDLVWVVATLIVAGWRAGVLGKVRDAQKF